MKFNVHVWVAFMLAVLLIGTSARPYGIAAEHDDQIRRAELSTGDSSTSFFGLFPRAFKLPKLGGSKPKPAPAPKPSQPAPAPSKSAPAPSKPASSVPASSVPASSVPASSVPASSVPASSVSSVSASSASSVSSASVSGTSVSGSSSVSSTVSSASSSSSSAAASDAPRKCNSESCGFGKACKAKTSGGKKSGTKAARAIAREIITETVDKRDFGTFKKESDVDALAAAEGSVDVSAFGDRNTDFIPFDASPHAVTVTGLEGCTVVAAMSAQGMQVAHMFESSEAKDIRSTLHPNFFAQTVADVGKLFAPNKARFAGGQVVLMLPVDPNNPSQFKYESEISNGFNEKTGKLDARVKKVSGKGTVAAITKMITDSIGVAPTIVKYTPPKTDAEAQSLQAKDSIRGTFVAQYDPANQPGSADTPAAVQVFVEGKAQLKPALALKPAA